MADEFQLRIVTPRAGLVDEPVLEVTAPGSLGEIGILPDHAALLTSLEVGRLTYRSRRGSGVIAVRGGFAEVSANTMTVLADAAEAAENIDTAKAEVDLRLAESKLEDVSPLDDSFATGLADYAAQLARRAAEYKRASLLFHDLGRLRRIAERWPLQVVFAGKAHPRDEAGKREIRAVFRAAAELGEALPVVYVEDYDMDPARVNVIRVDFLKGVLVAADDHRRLINIEQKQGLFRHRLSEQKLLHRQIYPRICLAAAVD